MGIVDQLAAVLNGIAALLFQAQAALIPYGLAMAQSLTVLAIMWGGIAFGMGATGMLGSAIHMTAVATLTTAAVRHWPEITRASLDTVDFVLGALGIGNGPSGLFTLAVGSGQRIAGEMIGFRWADVDGSLFESFFGAIAAIIVPVALVIPAIMASAARLQVLLTAALAPILLPFLAVGLFRSFGMTAFAWQVSGVTMASVLGIASYAIAESVAQTVTLAGTDQILGVEAVWRLLFLAVAGIFVAWSVWRLSGRVSVNVAGGMLVGSTLGAAQAVAGAAMGARGGGGASAGGAAGGMGGGRGATGAGSVQRASGSGSAFRGAA